MTVQSVTLQLPEAIMRRAKHAADALQRPLEEMLTDMLTATLPDVENVPIEMQGELARMTWLSNQELWTIAQSMMADDRQKQLQNLVELQIERPLTQREQITLDQLRQEYGRVTLYKARAYALLSLRGGQPLLAAGWHPPQM
jgi:hypothetical protein